MPYPTGMTYEFSVVFYNGDNLPFVPNDTPTITIISPTGATSTSAATQVGSTAAFKRSGVLTVGTWRWYGTTTDPEATNGTTIYNQIEAVEYAGGVTLQELVTALSMVGVTIQSPVDSGDTITLVEGDSYYTADGRAIEFDLNSPLFSLVGATAVFKVGTVEYPMTISGDVLTLELSSAETAAMGVVRHRYEIKLTLANTHVITPVKGLLIITPAQD